MPCSVSCVCGVAGVGMGGEEGESRRGGEREGRKKRERVREGERE